MSNKPSAKAIAKLNATTLFPEIKKEIEKNPSLFTIRGFYIFNITKKGVPMTEWYMLFQGFDAPAVVSQKRPEIPKAKRDEQPIPVAIIQIEDRDLLNFMSGGLTGSRGIVSGKIKIAGAMELAEELERMFSKAKGTEKTLTYLDQKRGKSEKARARLSSSQISSSPPSSSPLTDAAKTPAATAASSKVQSLARRYSALTKQAAANSSYVPHNNIGKLPQAGGIAKASPATATKTSTPPTTTQQQSQPLDKTAEVIQEQREEESVQEDSSAEVEQEIESNLSVADLADKVKDIDLVETPLEEEQKQEQTEEPEQIQETEIETEVVVQEQEELPVAPIQFEEPAYDIVVPESVEAFQVVEVAAAQSSVQEEAEVVESVVESVFESVVETPVVAEPKEDAVEEEIKTAVVDA
ncbi:hypothetical protein BGZ58_007565 [Dissophora ornata]|nr:hypothetical protein BGZ58_007565 [Dissophora ornata]